MKKVSAAAALSSTPDRIPGLGFFASGSVVRKMGSCPKERVTEALALGGMIAGVLVASIALTAVLAMYVNKTAAGVVFAGLFGSLIIGLPVGALASWFLRTAYLEPRGLTMLLSRFHATTEGQSADPAMKARIEGAASGMNKVSRFAGF